MERQRATGSGQQKKYSQLFPLHASRLPSHTSHLTPHASCLTLLSILCFLALSPATVSAQPGSAMGWVIQITGMVQVEPGPNVLTLGVKDEEIRFIVHDVYSRDRNFTMGQFFSEVRNRTPNIDIKGQDALLEMLIKERPSKRVLKLSGIYYLDAHAFMVNAITQVQDKPAQQF